MDKPQNDQFEELKKLSEFLKQQQSHSHPCPSCGHCPSCGRGGYLRTWPYYQPYWTGPVWVSDQTTIRYAVDGNVMNTYKVTC